MGSTVGPEVGLAVGPRVGLAVGPKVGLAVGPKVGLAVGLGVAAGRAAGRAAYRTAVNGSGSGTCEGILGPAPDSFTATARNVYRLPGSRPLNTAVPPALPLIVTDCPPGIAITVIDVIGEDPVFSGALNVTARASAPIDLIPVISGIPGAPSAIVGFCSGSTDTHRMRLSVRPSHPPDTMIRATPVPSFTQVVTTNRTGSPPTEVAVPAVATALSPASPDRADTERFAASSETISAQSFAVNPVVSPPVFSTTASARALAEITRPTCSPDATIVQPCAISETGSHVPRGSTRATPVARFRHVDRDPRSCAASAACGHEANCSPDPSPTATSTTITRATIRVNPAGMILRTSN